MTHLIAVLAVLLRNLRIGMRRPDLLIQSVAVPIVVLGLAAIIFGGSDAWPVAVVDKSQSPASQRLIETIEETEGSVGPYYRIVETSPAEARDLVRNGRLQLLLEIPADYASTGTVKALTYNINTDAMKNVRLRLAVTQNLYDAQFNSTLVTAAIDKVAPTDVRRSAFMGGSAVILAFLLGCALITANLYSVETEYRSTKEISLTPIGSHAAGLGAALAGWILALITTLPTLLLALVFGTTSTVSNFLQSATIVLPAGFAAAGCGVVAATMLRTHQNIQPTLILLALGSYFASGGFISVSALPPLARQFAVWWPPSYVFETANPILHGFAAAPSGPAVAVAVMAGLGGLALAMWASQREPERAHKQGQ